MAAWGRHFRRFPPLRYALPVMLVRLAQTFGGRDVVPEHILPWFRRPAESAGRTAADLTPEELAEWGEYFAGLEWEEE